MASSVTMISAETEQVTLSQMTWQKKTNTTWMQTVSDLILRIDLCTLRLTLDYSHVIIVSAQVQRTSIYTLYFMHSTQLAKAPVPFIDIYLYLRSSSSRAEPGLGWRLLNV